MAISTLLKMYLFKSAFLVHEMLETARNGIKIKDRANIIVTRFEVFTNNWSVSPDHSSYNRQLQYINIKTCLVSIHFNFPSIQSVYNVYNNDKKFVLTVLKVKKMDVAGISHLLGRASSGNTTQVYILRTNWKFIVSLG